MKIGDKVYYTGDMANNDGMLIITNIYNDKWGDWVDMDFIPERWEKEREDFMRNPINGLPITAFNPGPGRRFWLYDEWRAKRKADYESIYKSIKRVHLLGH